MPLTPTGLTAYGTNGAVTLDWDEPLDDVDSYSVYVSSTEGGSYTLLASGIEALTYTDSGLTNGTKRWYKIVAVFEATPSSQSAARGATPHLPAVGVGVTGPTTGGLTSGTFTVTAYAAPGNVPTKFYPSEDSQSGSGEAVTLSTAADITFDPVSPLEAADGSETVTFDLTAATVGSKAFTVGFPGQTVLPVTYTAADVDPPAAYAAVASYGAITLSWDSAGEGYTYNVYASDTIGGAYTLLAGGVDALTYVDRTIIQGVPRWYKLATVLDDYESDKTDAFCAPTITGMRFVGGSMHQGLVNKAVFPYVTLSAPGAQGGTPVYAGRQMGEETVGFSVWSTLGGEAASAAANAIMDFYKDTLLTLSRGKVLNVQVARFPMLVQQNKRNEDGKQVSMYSFDLRYNLDR